MLIQRNITLFIKQTYQLDYVMMKYEELKVTFLYNKSQTKNKYMQF